jgi:hypothetical protein
MWTKNTKMAIKYTQIAHSKTYKNKPKLGFLVWKYRYNLAILAQAGDRTRDLLIFVDFLYVITLHNTEPQRFPFTNT